MAVASFGCGGGFVPTHLQTDPVRVIDAAGGADELRALRAEARIDQRGERGRIRGTVFMFVARPASVRVDAMSQFGPVSILTTDGQQFSLSDFREHRYLTGPACPQNVARLLRLPMTVEETVGLLLGGSVVVEAKKREMVWDRAAGDYVITLHAADGHTQRLRAHLLGGDRDATLDAQRFDVVGSELRAPDGRVLWRVRLQEHRALSGGVRFPHRVQVTQPDSDIDTLIRFKKVVENPELPPGVFQQAPAAGLQIEEAACE